MPNNPDNVIILEGLSGRLSAKVFHPGKDGQPSAPVIKPDYLFSVERVALSGVDDFWALLPELEKARTKCAIRGEPKPGIDLRCTPRNGDQFVDVPRHLLCIDLDKLQSPPDLDWVRQPELGVHHAIAQLPPEFQGMNCVWQYSSSAGVHNTTDVKLHLWYWLAKARTSEELRAWAKWWNTNCDGAVVDEALYRTVQPHFTAAPVFLGGLVDPLPTRSGIFYG